MPNRLPFSDSGDIVFTPEAFPGLSPEACAVFNTPITQCDPDILHLVFSALAQHIASGMPTGSGMTDPESVFSTLWSRLGTLLAQSVPDAPPVVEPAPAPATPVVAAADAPPAPLLQVQGTQPADAAAIVAIAAWNTMPGFAAATGPGCRRDRALSDNSRSLRHCCGSLRHCCRAPARCCRTRVGRGVAATLRRPPPRRLFYAACAGPT